MKNPEIVKGVQRLSKQLESDLVADKRLLPSLDPDKLTGEKYRHFLDLDYQVRDIKKVLGLGIATFQNRRKTNGVESKISRKQKKEKNKLTKLNINTVSLLLPETFGIKGKECTTISKGGLALSGPVVRRLSKPEWVQSYLDESGLALLVIPCKATDKDARSCVNLKSKKKAGYRKSWSGSILEKVSKANKIDIENHRYHVEPESVKGYPTALGFNLTKAIKD